MKELLYMGAKITLLSNLFFFGLSYTFAFLPERRDSNGHSRSRVIESAILSFVLAGVLLVPGCSERRKELHKREKAEQSIVHPQLVARKEFPLEKVKETYRTR